MKGPLMTNLDDVGTRKEHLLDLYELWAVGRGILERNGSLSSTEQARLIDLEIALKLLWYHLTQDYNANRYIDEINQLPRPEGIK